VKELESELQAVKSELGSAVEELERVKLDLNGANVELERSKVEKEGLEWALSQSQLEVKRFEERVEMLEGYLKDMGVDASSVVEKKIEVSS
jgi:predicted  nucleic acid-binding Zn-ribbon protein